MRVELAVELGAEQHIRRALASAEAGGAAAHRLGHAVALDADPEPAGLLATNCRLLSRLNSIATPCRFISVAHGRGRGALAKLRDYGWPIEEAPEAWLPLGARG